jgi:hypothetical protein
MLRIQRSEWGSGLYIERPNGRKRYGPVETRIRSEVSACRMILDLKDITLLGRDAISFLECWEAKGIVLKNCAANVREWITRQRRGNERLSRRAWA